MARSKLVESMDKRIRSRLANQFNHWLRTVVNWNIGASHLVPESIAMHSPAHGSWPRTLSNGRQCLRPVVSASNFVWLCNFDLINSYCWVGKWNSRSCFQCEIWKVAPWVWKILGPRTWLALSEVHLATSSAGWAWARFPKSHWSCIALDWWSLVIVIFAKAIKLITKKQSTLEEFLVS